jgi:predicted nucleic acid-binding Zn ribbon protein
VLLGDCLRKVLDQWGLGEQLRERDVLGAWHELVGDFIARHSAPHSLKDGVLVIRVVQPTVRYELERQWRGEILRKFRERFGARVVRDVKFRIG